MLAFLPAVLCFDVGLRQDGAELTDDLVTRVLVVDADAAPERLADHVEGNFPIPVPVA